MITLQDITKTFRTRNSEVTALNHIDLHIGEGEFALIKGPSGCGKSTCLFTLGGMLKPDKGKVLSNGHDIYRASTHDLLLYRSRMTGFVYQSYHLIPYLDILGNILLVNRTGQPVVTQEEVMELAQDFNLADRLHHKPSELSVGERQRAALMRALAVRPRLLIADEPTGNLDPMNSRIIMTHFKSFQQQGGTVIMASHGNEADEMATLHISMEKGCIVGTTDRQQHR